MLSFAPAAQAAMLCCVQAKQMSAASAKVEMPCHKQAGGKTNTMLDCQCKNCATMGSILTDLPTMQMAAPVFAVLPHFIAAQADDSPHSIYIPPIAS